MARTRKSYTKNQKFNIVRKLLESGNTMEQVAKEEGVSIASLNRWKKDY